MTYYQLLEVSETADQETIKRSYRRLAKKYHPDVNPGNKSAEETFKKIAHAYEILSDQQRRASYDYLLYLQRNPRPQPENSRPYTGPTQQARPTPVNDEFPPWVGRILIWCLIFFVQWRTCNKPPLINRNDKLYHINLDSLLHQYPAEDTIWPMDTTRRWDTVVIDTQ